MSKLFHVVLIVSIFATFVRADDSVSTASKVPDFQKMEHDVLVIMCEQLWKRVADLEQQVETLESKLVSDAGGEAGGSIAGDVVAVDRGTWTVTISHNPEPDVSALEAELQSTRTSLQTYQQDVTTAQTNVNNVLRKRPYDKQDNPYGYKQAERSSVELALKNAKRKVKGAEMRINQLTRQIDVERNSRIITGTTDDGVPVKIEARGVSGPLGAGLRVNQTYLVTGRGSVTDDLITIRLQSVSPATN